MSYLFNTISITIKGIQEHINSRNKVWIYPIYQRHIALQDLRDQLMVMNYEDELPKELVNDVYFDCRDYMIKIHFYNEFYIVESSTNKSEVYTEFFENEDEADEAFEHAEKDCMSVYKEMGDLDSIRGLNLYVIKSHYKGQDQETHDMIAKSEIMDMFKIQEVEGSVLMSKNPLIF